MSLRDKAKVTQFQKFIGYKFKDPTILKQALTTPQFGNEFNIPHYEILETLGDAVIKLIFSLKIYKDVGITDPGMLTRTKQCLESNQTLIEIASRMELWKYIYASNNQNFKQSSIMGDVLEAIVGALFIDANEDLKIVEEKIINKFFGTWDDIIQRSSNFAKNNLLEYLQSKYKITPSIEYQYQSQGPQHDLHWIAKEPRILDQNGNMLLSLPKNLKTNTCKTKKEAEKELSEKILEFLKRGEF